MQGQGLSGLTQSQLARLEALRLTDNKRRARQGLAPLSLAEFADHYRAESAAAGATSTFLDAREPGGAASSSGTLEPVDAFAQLNAPYLERMNAARPPLQSAASQADQAPGVRSVSVEASSDRHVAAAPDDGVLPAVSAGDLFAKANERYEQATARARVGGSREAAAIGDGA